MQGRSDLKLHRSESAGWSERFPLSDIGWAGAFAATMALWALAWFLRWKLDADLPPGFPFLTFFPAVFLTTFLFATRYGILSAVLCGLTAWHQFTPPMQSWDLNSGGTLAMAFFGFITSTEILIIHWMQRANRQLQIEREASANLAQTRELLFRELQHRVSNNLQMVAGLLTLQKRSVTDRKARAALDEASRRMGVIGRISRQLYDPDGDSRSMSVFLHRLAEDVVDASGRRGISIRVHVADEAPLPPDTAIPLALIVAEAVSNAIEHGFEGRKSGSIDIRMGRGADQRVQLEVEDDGAGLPPDFNPEERSSLGLQIAHLLAQQIGGTFRIEPTPSGALNRLDFPLKR